MSGDNLCLLAIERPVTGSNSSWRICIDEHELVKGYLFVKSFRDIEGHGKKKRLFRTTSGIFLPYGLAKVIVRRKSDYALRTSPSLIDIVLPQFMEREEWIRLSHQQGFGVNSHSVWKNA